MILIFLIKKFNLIVFKVKSHFRAFLFKVLQAYLLKMIWCIIIQLTKTTIIYIKLF